MRLQFYLLILTFLLFAAPLTAQKKSQTLDVLTVDFCELINQPSKYDKKIVRTKAIYVSGYHGTSLYGYKCNSGEASMSADGEEESNLFRTKENIRKKYDQIVNESEDHRAYVTVVGRFNDWNGFGHGSFGWYRFEFAVFSFESIELVASTVPWKEKKNDFMAEIENLRGLNLNLVLKDDAESLSDTFSNDYVFIDLQNKKFDKSKVLEIFSVSEPSKRTVRTGKIFIDGNKAVAKEIDAIAYICPSTIFYQFQFNNYYEKQNNVWKLTKTQIISDKSSIKLSCN